MGYVICNYNYQPSGGEISKGLNPFKCVVLAYNIAWISNFLPEAIRINSALEFSIQVYFTALNTVDCIAELELCRLMGLNIRKLRAKLDAVSNIFAVLLGVFKVAYIVTNSVKSKKRVKKISFGGVLVSAKNKRE